MRNASDTSPASRASPAISPAIRPERQPFRMPPPVTGSMRRAASPTSMRPSTTDFSTGFETETPPATSSMTFPFRSSGRSSMNLSR